MKNGIIYIVFGNKSLEEFRVSIKSLRKIHPKVHITLFSDRLLNNEYVDDNRIINVSGTRIKQDHLFDSPYENTLYIDATSGVVGAVTDLFDMLNRFDLGVIHDIVRKNKRHASMYPEYATVPDAFPEFSGGILLFRKCRAVEKFFRAWRKNFKIWYDLTNEHRDQPSLRVSLWQCQDLRIFTLPLEYSIRTKKYHNIIPRVFHFHEMTEQKLQKELSHWNFKHPGLMK